MTLEWTTTNATTCSIDHGVGSVPCNGNTNVSPTTTTTYTLSATGPGGGPVTAQTTVTVQYCHAITRNGGACPTGATQFCESVPIDATSSNHAQDACNTCFGAGSCVNSVAQFGGNTWLNSATRFFYSNASGPGVCGYVPQAGDIASDGVYCFISRWAP